MNVASGNLPGRIRQAREAASLSQQELAVRVGVSLRTVQLWESGDRDPQLATVAKIALATGRRVSFFVDDLEAAA